MPRLRRWVRRISGAAIATTAATMLHGQAQEFEGSIFNLDPPALQSTDLEQVIGSDETTPLNQFHETDYYRRLGKPIGRLAVEFLNGKSAYCTASLISDDLILTNAHCLLDSTGTNVVRAGLLWMGYLTAGEAEGGAQFIVDMRNPVEVGFPGADGAPDYAILKVQSGTPGKDWGTVKLASRAPADRSSLVVVHHPLGFPMVVSAGGKCRSNRASDDDVYHVCDTQPGSSGAPVYSLGDSQVVALHYRKAGTDENAAVRADRLLASSAVLRGIVAGYDGADVIPAPETLPDPEPEVVEPAPQPDPTPVNPGIPAAEAWALIKDDYNEELLIAYIDRYEGSFYADIARSRLYDLQNKEEDVAVVTPQPQPQPTTPQINTGPWFVVMGSYTNRANAQDRRNRLVGQNLGAYVVNSNEYPGMTPNLWVVVEGPYDRSTAVSRLSLARASVSDAFVKRGY
ncbi:MAG: trypsin-like serine protease [Rhodobacteraceae bacterium]|nr:trypsin-like serine protease [Paracoccaceae bacterium]